MRVHEREREIEREREREREREGSYTYSVSRHLGNTPRSVFDSSSVVLAYSAIVESSERPPLYQL